MSEGFFLLHRGWRENPIFRGEFSRADAWVWLIENACWKPSRTRIKGETIELERGELSFSIRFLAESWGWSKSRVDRFLSDLRDEGMIETRSKNGTVKRHKAGQGQSIISIVNYRKYQDNDHEDAGQQKPKQRDNSGTTAGQQRDKEEQGNKETRLFVEANASTAQKPIEEEAELDGVGEEPAGDTDLFGDPAPPAPPELKPEHVVEVWNDLAGEIGRPAVRDLTPERRALLKARIAAHTIDDFTEAIDRIRCSPFLRGERKWSGVTFDWFIKKSNFLKILEGNYSQ